MKNQKITGLVLTSMWAMAMSCGIQVKSQQPIDDHITDSRERTEPQESTSSELNGHVTQSNLVSSAEVQDRGCAATVVCLQVGNDGSVSAIGSQLSVSVSICKDVNVWGDKFNGARSACLSNNPEGLRRALTLLKCECDIPSFDSGYAGAGLGNTTSFGVGK